MPEICHLFLPEEFVRNIAGLHGARGEKWLARLPQILAEAREKWSLEIDAPFSNLTFNFVAPCINQAGENAVLKICVPEDNPPILQEKNALEAFAGKGAVKVLAFDENLCALLLEKATPGKTLREIFPPESARAVQIAVGVMKNLPRQPPDKAKFSQIEYWTKDLAKARKTDFEPQNIKKARRIFADLREPFEKRMLLHGDIHFENILSASRAPFLLIDPKGCVGEIGYEIAVFLNDLAGSVNHLKNQEDILENAARNFAESFGLEIKEIRQWAFAQAILAAWWMFDDFGRDWENYLACARMWELKGI